MAREQSGFWKSIDVDSCEPKPGMHRTGCTENNLSNYVTGHRPQSLSLAGITFGYVVKCLLIVHAEILRDHRQGFIFSEEGLLSLPLLPEVARFFEGQVACSLVVSSISPCVPDRLLARALATAMLSFSFCTSCKFELPSPALSYPFCTSGKLSVSPDQGNFNVEEEFKRLV